MDTNVLKITREIKPIDDSHLFWTCGFKDCKYIVCKIYDMLEMVVKDIKDRILINEKYKKDSLLVSSKLSNFLSKTVVSLPFESPFRIRHQAWTPFIMSRLEETKQTRAAQGVIFGRDKIQNREILNIGYNTFRHLAHNP